MALAESTELAYERAFQTHWGDVFRFALAWTLNDWAAAEDLAQEAFLRLWDHRGDLDWDRPVLPWLLVATRRLATPTGSGLSGDGCRCRLPHRPKRSTRRSRHAGSTSARHWGTCRRWNGPPWS